MHQIYIIAGCNGSGKTTASKTLLPNILDCGEFINADDIARSISPFNVEAAAIEAGRIMLHKIDDLMAKKHNFAIETTLTSISYIQLIKNAKQQGYEVTLLFLWLNSADTAVLRVSERVKKGGHSIPPDVVRRRYFKGIKNLFSLFIPNCDNSLIFDNSDNKLEIVAELGKNEEHVILNENTWNTIKAIANGI